ncbi:Phenylacetate-CoA oxygenase, PaaG subunit [Euzebya pacifica]|jgi:ring-1,2-phenylacetyl-CoA epoxidase subunit PaaA|uniref:Phenylacetate-CoA oxygenase, PaaG subunit n=1 Tax=Euzebya pacifica TaxID=1608957 RepID=A0A346XUZ7_9ACTN|nr:1,2-phenylacetyl-CoA epoxidase subunit PaaA [Euzebya pacifica]AXV06044.1 Phenylacetate-CoA oxygenase, PaaG subunit [Euzebya pacifica]
MTTLDTDLEQRTAAFVEHVQAGGTVEADDWMPDEYRQMAIKFIEMHANSELMGALPEREWISRAPTLRRKMSLTAKVQDEVGHGHLIYRVAEDLGKPRPEMLSDLLNKRTKFHNVFHYPTMSWGDVAVIGCLVDGAAIITQTALLTTSLAPYRRVMKRVCAEESFHQRHGEDLLLELGGGTEAQREMLQDAVNRWWVPVMHFFGPKTPAEKDRLLYWRIKTETNEELRQRFFDRYVPKLWDLGISIPDPALSYDPDADHWTWTEPSWDELRTIAKGNGPMTDTRLSWRIWMTDANSWARELMGEPRLDTADSPALQGAGA